MEEIILPDLSAIQLKAASHLVREGRAKGRFLIHRVLLKKIEDQASQGDTMAMEGLKDLVNACEERNIKLDYVGDLRDRERSDRLLIVEEAARLNAKILTCDPVMAQLAASTGLRLLYELPPPPFSIAQLFEEDVMSIHVKEGLPPRVKRGIPGRWRFVEVSEKPVSRHELELLIAHLMREAYKSFGVDAFLEIDKPGVKIFQLKDYRVVITRPPFSDGFELTVVKPVIRRDLRDYYLPPQVVDRLENRAEGILIAGPPGMGKSTFAQALAEYYRSLNKVVKTIESPRDLRVSPDITQYSKTAAKQSELHDVLLLSRPDYTIFDEIRDSSDFDLFIDLRLAGIGMVGVIHATSPIDAIQRVANRVDVGLLPSIIDTVIFMDKGEIQSIYVLEMTVKVPAGLKKADLARPTVIVKDLLTDEPLYELYVFGERTFVVPIKKLEERKKPRAPVRQIMNTLQKHIPDFRIEEEGSLIRIYIPGRYYRVYVRKVQNKLLKIARKYSLTLEALPS